MFYQKTNRGNFDRLSMVRSLAVVVGILLGLGATQLQAQSSATTDDSVLLKEVTTPDGNTFWYYPLPKADRTALFISWEQEVPADGSVHPAVARIARHVMMNGGAGGRSAAEIVGAFEDLDAGSDLWVEARSVSGFFVAPDGNLAAAREIAAQVITEPAFEERWFDREHQAYLEAVQEEQSQLGELAWNLVGEVLLKDHPYRDFWSNKPIDELEALSLEDVKNWHKSSFSKKSSTISVAGSASADAISKEIDLLFQDMPDTPQETPVTFNQPEIAGKTILLHAPDAPKSLLLLVGNLPADSEEVNLPFSLGLAVLGGSAKSRLFKSVRSELGASYDFGAGQINLTRDQRLLQMGGEIETVQLQKAINTVEKTYNKFRSDGVGRIEFPLSKRLFKREIVKQLSDPVSVAYQINKAVQTGFSAEYLSEYKSHVDSLSRADTNRFINESFPEYKNLLKIIVSPDKAAVDGACVISKIEEAGSCF